MTLDGVSQLLCIATHPFPMIELATSLIPLVGNYIQAVVRDRQLAQQHAEKICRAVTIELRFNLELIELLDRRDDAQPDPGLLKEVLPLLQLEILQSVYGMEVDVVLAMRNIDGQLKNRMDEGDGESEGLRLPSFLTGKPVSDILDYLLRKGMEMKAIASLSEEALSALSKSIHWRRRLDNYRDVLLFAIRDLKSNP